MLTKISQAVIELIQFLNGYFESGQPGKNKQALTTQVSHKELLKQWHNCQHASRQQGSHNDW